jgi:hypothetical protein
MRQYSPDTKIKQNMPLSYQAATKLAVAICLFLAMVLVGLIPVKAQSSNFNANLNLGGGSLSISTTGASCSLTATVSASNQTVNCNVTPITMSDLRGTGVGWSTTFTVTNFFSGSVNSIPLCSNTGCGTPYLTMAYTGVSLLNNGSYSTTSGFAYGATDQTSLQTPSSLTNLSSTGTNSPGFSFLSFTAQAYGRATVTSGGTGYSTAPTVGFTGGTCSQNPVATASVDSGAVTDITFTTIGICSLAPTDITFTGVGGAGATAVGISGSGEGTYTKGTNLSLTIPAYTRNGTYTSTITYSIA